MAGTSAFQRAGEPVWVRLPPDRPEAYIDAKVVSADGPNAVTVTMAGEMKVISVDDMLHVNPDTLQPDLTNLMILNDATMLDNLRQRFNQGKIYTRASTLLM